jgi:CRISPR-associated endonuclease/helicase Cas3
MARFTEQTQMLCIVNSRRHAYELYDRIKGMAGAVHLTTLMCAKHRREVLDRVRALLANGEPARVVSTSLVEAGVDVDFPEVWRAVAGLDQIAQSAGRCNREGKLQAFGRTVVFSPADHKPPLGIRAFQQVAEGVLRRHEDPLTLEAVRDYFMNLYWTKGEAALDAAHLDGEPFPILRAIAERSGRLDFPFASVARAFRLIDESMEPVVAPWDEEAKAILARVGAMDRPRSADLRALQQYTISIPSLARDRWVTAGVLRPVHAALKESLLAFADLALYDDETGLRLFDPTLRSPHDNLF